MTDIAPFTAGLPKKEKHKEIMKAVRKVLNDMEFGTKFSGSQLPKMVADIEPKCVNTEGETIRRYMRYLREGKDYTIFCVDRNHSIYEKQYKGA